MQRRPLALVLDVLLMLVGALLGIATNYATNVEGEVPLPLRLLRQWSIPLVGIGLLALVAGQLWLRWLERRPVAVPARWTAGQPLPGITGKAVTGASSSNRMDAAALRHGSCCTHPDTSLNTASQPDPVQPSASA
ncbi:hypothetical protein [Streptomyces virginiae]|uniref:Uncharacterized protein n=1 Tax=Streptomyces virginiae TaxID=1961 RepID=A0ABZ1TNJ2_STRVG|nr:hypothetical protein [Streptomyces virginiae]